MGKHGESVGYDGVMWHPRGDGYYQNKHRGLLHRHMYSREIGPIPNGMQVHHKNHVKSDNRADNLVLLRPGEHWHEHHGERGEDWHAKGGRASWKDVAVRDFTCQRCGEPFQSRSHHDVVRYCSNACRDYGSRPREERVCRVCGDTFECAVRSTSSTCSRKCTADYVAQIKRSRVRPDG